MGRTHASQKRERNVRPHARLHDRGEHGKHAHGRVPAEKHPASPHVRDDATTDRGLVVENDSPVSKPARAGGHRVCKSALRRSGECHASQPPHDPFQTVKRGTEGGVYHLPLPYFIAYKQGQPDRRCSLNS